MDAAEVLSRTRDAPDASPDRQPAGPSLTALAGLVRPLVPASDLTIPVPGALAAVMPALRRGTVLSVEGSPGSGATTVALGLAAAAGAAGEWAAWLGGPAETPTLSALAAQEAGAALGRVVVVPEVSRDRWGVVASALVEGVSLLVAETPRGVRVGDARRLVARVREQRAVLVVFGSWPERAAVRIRVEPSPWSVEHGRLATRPLTVEIEERGRFRRSALG